MRGVKNHLPKTSYGYVLHVVLGDAAKSVKAPRCMIGPAQPIDLACLSASPPDRQRMKLMPLGAPLQSFFDTVCIMAVFSVK